MKEKINSAIAIHKRIEEKVQKELTFNKMRIAGYMLRTEGLDSLKRHGKKDTFDLEDANPMEKCPCGSGRPYNKCCIELVSF